VAAIGVLGVKSDKFIAESNNLKLSRVSFILKLLLPWITKQLCPTDQYYSIYAHNVYYVKLSINRGIPQNLLPLG